MINYMVDYMAINVKCLSLTFKNLPINPVFPPFPSKSTFVFKNICLSHKFSLPLHPYSTSFLSALRVFHPRVEVVIR